MDQLILVTSLLFVLTAVFVWGFRVLPKEEWQILAVIPVRKELGGWSGVNLTYYGLFVATAAVFAVAVVVLLLGSVGLHPRLALLLALLELAIGVPGAKLVAALVERRPHRSTVAGAAFAVGVIMPPLVLLVNRWEGFGYLQPIPLSLVITASFISYCFGEGLGRLGCISFGCCYGKPMVESPLWIRKRLLPLALVFTGRTKKVAYEGRMENQALIPVQAFTAAFNSLVGTLAVWLFLENRMPAACAVAGIAPQLWRVVSERFRADYRGESSTYQLMSWSLAAWICILLAFHQIAPYSPNPNLRLGIQALGDSAVLVSLQVAWLLVFLYTGRSKVTAASVSIHLAEGPRE